MPTHTRKTQKPSGVVSPAAVAQAPKREYGQGRQKLLAAAARLVAKEGSMRLTLRDLAAEAGMSHNAIYRHFSGVDEMVQALIMDVNQRLRDGLRHVRAQVPSDEALSRTVVNWLFDFALAHSDEFVVAVRERHGPSGPAREAIEQGMAMIMAGMRSDLQASRRLPALPAEMLDIA